MTDCEFTVNSARTLADAHKWLDDNFKVEGFTRYKCRHGKSASLPMNALLHVWLTELAAHFAKCDPKEASANMVEGMKRSAKGFCYRETAWAWLVCDVFCPMTHRSKVDYTSSASWVKGKKSDFLNWLQVFAAQHGCILESKGEFAELKKAQHE